MRLVDLFMFLKQTFAIFLLSFLLIWIDGFPGTSAETKYSIIIDAGSSGSRMFLYSWPVSRDTDGIMKGISVVRDKKNELVVHKNSPGLSSLTEDISKLEPYLKDLIDHAIRFIPKAEIPKTHLFILATAGMRFLSDHDQERIWTEVRRIITNNYDLHFTKDMAKTISGFKEGVYGWVAVNYLAQTLLKETRDQIGMVDLGGGSMQIAFNVANRLSGSPDPASTFKFKIGERAYEIYSTTYLGYGVNSARKMYRASLVINAKPTSFDQSHPLTLHDGCLHKNAVDVVMAEDFEEYDSFFHTNYSPLYSKGVFILEGIGSLDDCLANQAKIMGKDVPCKYNSCGMVGTYQPTIPQNKDNTFYGLSEFWYTTNDVSVPHHYDYPTFHKDASAYCAKNVSQISVISYAKFVKENPDHQNFEEILEKKKDRCFISSWIITTLHEGFGFSKDYKNFKPVDFIREIEVQWSLGALILLYSDVNIQTGISIMDLITVKKILIFLAVIVGLYIFKKFFLLYLWTMFKSILRLEKSTREGRVMTKTNSYQDVGSPSKLMNR